MRNIIVAHMVLLSIAFTQSYVIVEPDSVEFGMLNLRRNCGAGFVMNVEMVDSIYTIVAIDSGGMATCGSCNFDVKVVVGGVVPGNYSAQFYTYDISDIVYTDSTWDNWEYTRDTSFIGEVEFTIESPPLVPYSILSSYQSPCTHGMDIDEEIHPSQQTLIRNYPNPFNQSTNIEFILPDNDFWEVSVFDLNGIEISNLASRNFIAGFHELKWEAESAPSGVYLIRITSSMSVSTAKMLLLK